MYFTHKKVLRKTLFVGIDVRNLYQNGGMVHCVTQQQPK
ncbi:agmatine deiminase family protein [Flavobacterium laiguense]|nr:agmatine deiminase family protein [Flavobacterium laiguense]